VATAAYPAQPAAFNGSGVPVSGQKNTAAAAQVLGLPTEEEIKAALRSGAMPAKTLVNMFKYRLVSS
jgi:hypothetical protein